MDKKHAMPFYIPEARHGGFLYLPWSIGVARVFFLLLSSSYSNNPSTAPSAAD